MSDLDRLFQQIPLLERYRSIDFDCQELSSVTNRNIRLTNDVLDLVLRIPGMQVANEVNRSSELHNQGIALDCGLALDVLWCREDGVMLSAWLPGSRNLRSEDLADNAIFQALVSHITVLHQSFPRFEGEVTIEERLRYFLKKAGLQIDEQQVREVDDLLHEYSGLKVFEVAPVNSHNDLNLNNCLRAGDGTLWMIDWEYSARASPYWDLATLSNQARLDSDQSAMLIDLYCRLHALDRQLNLQLLDCYQRMLTMLEKLWLQVHQLKVQ